MKIADVIVNANALLESKNHEKAESLLIKALFEKPDHLHLLATLGEHYHRTNNLNAAAMVFRRALKAYPNHPALLSNYINILYFQGEWQAALDYAEKAYRLEPETIEIEKNYAIKLREMKHFKKSIKHFQACRKKSNDRAFDIEIGLVQLYLGWHKQGWKTLENRFSLDAYSFSDNWIIPQWTGKESLKGKKILVLGEQGFGDTLLMTRFIPLLKEKGADVSLTNKKALTPLLSQLDVHLVDDHRIPQEKYDYFVYMMSLPHCLKQYDWTKWPNSIAFTVPPDKQNKYQNVFNRTPDQLKIGIIWSGNQAFNNNIFRAAPYYHFLNLAGKHPDVQFYSFQKDSDKETFKTHGLGTIIPLGQSFQDFGDTAAALTHMDLIIMTDTALAHLAGHLNIPVLNVLHYRPYWLYFPEKTDTPLYPSMRFLRQHTPCDWDCVFEHIDNLLPTLRKQDILKSIDEFLEKL